MRGYEFRQSANVTPTYLNPVQRDWKYIAAINRPEIKLLETKGKWYRPDAVVSDFESPTVLHSALETQLVLWSSIYSLYRHIRFLAGNACP